MMSSPVVDAPSALRPFDRWREIIRNSAKMLAAQAVQIPLQLVSVLVIPKFVTPVDYGLWRSLLLINQYSPYLQMGTQQAMVKEMPYLSGRGDCETRQVVLNNAFYYILYANLLLGVGLLAASFLTRGAFAGFYAHGFRIFAVIVLLTALSSFFQDYLRIDKEFTWLSILSSLTPAVNVVFSLGFLFLFRDVLGLAYALVIANTLTVGLALEKSGRPPFENVRVAEIRRLIRVGFPLMLIPVLYMLIVGVGQIMILFLLGPADLGYYSLALSIQGFIYLAPSVLGSTLVPYLFEDYGRTNSAAASAHMFTKPTMMIGIVSAYILVGVYLFIHLPIRYYLTQYQAGLPVIYILLLGLYGMTLIMVAGSFIVICGREKVFLKWQILTLAFCIVSTYGAIRGGYGITGVACATILTYLFYSTGILYVAFRIFLKRPSEAARQIAFLYLPFLSLCILLFLVVTFVPNHAVTFWGDLAISVWRSAILMVASTPLLYYYYRRYVRTLLARAGNP